MLLFPQGLAAKHAPGAAGSEMPLPGSEIESELCALHFTDINEPRPRNSLLNEQHLPGFLLCSLTTFS